MSKTSHRSQRSISLKESISEKSLKSNHSHNASGAAPKQSPIKFQRNITVSGATKSYNNFNSILSLHKIIKEVDEEHLPSALDSQKNSKLSSKRQSTQMINKIPSWDSPDLNFYKK